MQKKGDMGRCPIREKIIDWQKFCVVSYKVRLRCAIIKVAHQCQSKTLSPPDFESTYTNKARLRLWRCVKFDRSKTGKCAQQPLWRCVNFDKGGNIPPFLFCLFRLPKCETKSTDNFVSRICISVLYLIRKNKKAQVFGLNHNLKERKQRT